MGRNPEGILFLAQALDVARLCLPGLCTDSMPAAATPGPSRLALLGMQASTAAATHQATPAAAGFVGLCPYLIRRCRAWAGWLAAAVGTPAVRSGISLGTARARSPRRSTALL